MTLQAKANTGTGTDNLDTDLIGGVHTGVSKLKMGGPGVDEGTVASDNPMPVHPVNNIGQSLVGGTGGMKIEGPVEVTQLNYLGAPVSSTNGLPVEIVEGKGTQTFNPLYATIVDNTGSIISASGSLVVSGGTSVLKAGNPVSPTNAIETTIRDASGTNVATAGKLNVQIAGNDSPLSVSAPITAQVIQTNQSILNTNLLTGVADVNNWYDVGSACGFVFQFQGSTGISAGGITIEGTNDTGQPFAIPLGYVKEGVRPPATEVGEIAVPASSQVVVRVTTSTRFIRARISTAFTGGTVTSRANVVNASSLYSAQEPILTPLLSTSTLSAIDTNIINGLVSAAGWVDTRGATEIVYQVIASAGIAAGAIFLEATNDPTSNVGTPVAFEEPSTFNARSTAAITIASNANRIFRAQLHARFVRIRISTAFVGGTIGARTWFKHGFAAAPNVIPVNASFANTGNVAVVSVVQTVASAVADGSASRLVSGVGATLLQNCARGVTIAHNITILTGGTAPTVQLRIQVQDPVSAVWVDLPGGLLPVRSTTGTFMTTVYPGIPTATDQINNVIPRTWRLAWNITGTPTGCTFSTATNYII